MGNRRGRGEGKPETFSFLGFTHICGTRWKDGRFRLLRLTDKKRMRRKLSDFKAKLKARVNDGMEDVGEWLRRAVEGYFNYFAVPNNLGRLASFRYALSKIWRKILCHRSQNSRMNWDAFNKWADCWIPNPRVVHPYPSVRFGARHS